MNKFASRPKEPKEFSFTWTKIKNYETCPRKYNEVELLKNYKEPPSDALTFGNRMHEAARRRIEFKEPLPAEFAKLEPHIERIGGGLVQTELRLAITKDMKPCDWFSNKAYNRGVLDVLKLQTRAALVADWKSGKQQNDMPQLGLYAQLVFSHYPQILVVVTRYIWLVEDDSNEEIIYRKDMNDLWAELNPRINALELATINNNFPPKKSGLCKAHCPVISCEYYGGKS
jgi:hypothetical protein